jgi:hypothetical protein
MSSKLSNCSGLNLINHLKQKNIPIEIKQYHYLSEQDMNKQKNNIVEVEVNFLKSNDYTFHIDLQRNKYDTWYTHKKQNELSKRPLWRTELTFLNNTVFALGYTKKESLVNAVQEIETSVKHYLHN